MSKILEQLRERYVDELIKKVYEKCGIIFNKFKGDVIPNLYLGSATINYSNNRVDTPVITKIINNDEVYVIEYMENNYKYQCSDLDLLPLHILEPLALFTWVGYCENEETNTIVFFP